MASPGKRRRKKAGTPDKASVVVEQAPNPKPKRKWFQKKPQVTPAETPPPDLEWDATTPPENEN